MVQGSRIGGDGILDDGWQSRWGPFKLPNVERSITRSKTHGGRLKLHISATAHSLFAVYARPKVSALSSSHWMIGT